MRDSVNSETLILCDPVAAGKLRGTHNCGTCDESFITAIRDFSLNQDTEVFSSLHCNCFAQWQHILKHEDMSLITHFE